MKSIKILVISAIIAVGFASCKKNEDPFNPQTEQEVAESSSYSEQMMTAVGDIGEQAMDQNGMQARQKAPFLAGGTCADITITNTSGTTSGSVGRRVTIDFGTTGCVGQDGRNRRGKIYIDFERPANSTATENPFNVVGRVITISFDNHFVDNVKVEGQHRTTVLDYPNAPANFALNRKHRVQVIGGKFTFSDGTTHEYSSDRIRTFNANYSPTGGNIDRSTIQIGISGTHNGKTRNNATFSGTILESEKLLFKMCNLGIGSASVPRLTPVQGRITLTSSNRQFPVTLDYGNGNCDNQYSISVNGLTFNLNF
jgi:hypothetical protein